MLQGFVGDRVDGRPETIGRVHILVAMVPEAQRLHSTLVSAFPAYVTAVFTERGYPLNREAAMAIEEATAFLDVELAIVLELDFREQRRSPLELFRAALEMLATTLADTGVPPALMAPATAGGDAYGLAPGSSSVLGPEAHTVHLAWGAAKAAAFTAGRSTTPTDPMILLMASDRGDQSRVVPLLSSPGVECLATRNPGAVAAAVDERPILVAFIDLAHRSAHGAVARLLDSGIPTIVYGDDVDDLVETGLRAQGVRAVIPRDGFVADPTRFLPRLA